MAVAHGDIFLCDYDADSRTILLSTVLPSFKHIFTKAIHEMEQPVQLPNPISLPAYKQKMYFVHRPIEGWQLTAKLDPKVVVVGLDQLTPPIQNDYLTYHRMILRTETLHGPKTVKEEILKIRDEHIRLIEAIRNDSWLPYYHREKVPRLDELDGAKINVSKYLQWTPVQISWYKDLCRHEWLAVLAVVHGVRIGEGEHQRYMKDLARVFPGHQGQQKNDGSMNVECKSLVSNDQQQNE